MSEYINVERPFLDKLRQFGWEVIDHTSTAFSADICAAAFLPTAAESAPFKGCV